MKRIALTAAAAAAAAALVLSACSSGGSGSGTSAAPSPASTDPVTISFTWWGNDDRAARYTEALKLFNEKYPYITVKTSFAAFPDYWTARSTEAAGRALPDVMQFDSAYLREYGANSHLLDLGPYVENGTISVDDFDASLVKAGEIDGKQIAIPTSTNTLAMFVNPDVATAAGVDLPADGYTWEDYNEYIQAVSDKDVKTADGYKVFGAGDYTGTFWFFLQWYVQQGKEPFSADGQLEFTQEDVVEFTSLTNDLRAADAVYPIDRGLSLAPKGGFTVNEASTEASWDNFLAGYSADSGKTNLSMMKIPSGPEGTANFFRPSMHLAVGANTKAPAAAATLVDFLLNEPEVGTIFGTSKGVPAAKAQRDAVDATEGSVDAQVIAYEEEIGTTDLATAPIPVKGFGTIEAKWKTLGEELAFKQITPEQFAEQWFAEAEMAIG